MNRFRLTHRLVLPLAAVVACASGASLAGAQSGMNMPVPGATPGPGSGSSAMPAGAVATGGDAALADPTYLAATLDGKSETPAADPDGTGAFKARLFVHDGKLCYTLTSANLSTLTMAHIHVGAVGVAGDPVFTLIPNVPTETCLKIETALATRIATEPDAYYVNIHTTIIPRGRFAGS